MAMLPNPLPKLAADPTGSALGLQLPPGALVDETVDGPWNDPLMWYADEPATPGSWTRLLPARRAGLHPVLIATTEYEKGPGDWRLAPAAATYPGDHDAEEVLADLWEDSFATWDEVVEELPDQQAAFDEMIAPFDDAWPGLAESPAEGDEDGTGEAVDPDARAAEVAQALTEGEGGLAGARPALVPARRSADVPAAIGWSGAINHVDDVAVVCAVLRSWEDRFGVRVVALSVDQLVVSVASPPTTTAEAEAIAAEHYAFCPDNITQGDYATLRAYAEEEVLNQPMWTFWWD